MIRPTVINVRDREAVAAAGDRLVYIGRRCGRWEASPWGNPFKVPPHSRDAALSLYREHVLARPDLLARLPELRGRVLGCWCSPHPCHGQILADLVEEQAATVVAAR